MMIIILASASILLPICFISGIVILIIKLNGSKAYDSKLHEQNMLHAMTLEHQQQHMDQVMHNPYITTGLDATVDRHYHGINNGLD